MDGLSWKTLLNWDDLGGKHPIFGNIHVHFGTLENRFTTGILNPDRLITGILKFFWGPKNTQQGTAKLHDHV